MRKIRSNLQIFRNFDFSKFFLQISVNISKMRVLLDLRLFWDYRHLQRLRYQKVSLTFQSQFLKKSTSKMKKYEFLLIFRTFFYVLAHISPEWESIWICNFFEVIEWHKDYTLLKFWRNRLSHSWEKYDQIFKIFDF